MIHIPLKKIVRNMLFNAVDGRYAGYRLMLTDIKSRYTRTYLGLIWEIIDPIMISIVFILLHKSRVISVISFDAPYALYVIIGMLLWRTFADALMLSLSSHERFSSLASSVRIFPETVLLSILFNVIFNLFFRLIVIFSVLVLFGYINFISWLIFFILLPSIILPGFVLGVAASPFNIAVRDIERIIKVSLWPWMLLSGTLFPLPDSGILSYVKIYNPVAVIIANLRSFLLFEQFNDSLLFFGVYSSSFCLLFISWYIFHVTFDIVSEFK